MKIHPAQCLAHLAIIGLLFSAFGCGTPSTIQTVTKDGEDFSAYSTYSIVKHAKTQTVPGVSPAELMWTQEIVGLEMARKGYVPAEADQADMRVTIESEVTGGRERGGISLGLGTGSYSRSGGSSVGVGTGPIGAKHIEQSTLSIRLVDPKTEKVLWVGWMDKLEDNKFTETEFKAKIREIMAQVPAHKPLG